MNLPPRLRRADLRINTVFIGLWPRLLSCPALPSLPFPNTPTFQCSPLLTWIDLSTFVVPQPCGPHYLGYVSAYIIYLFKYFPFVLSPLEFINKHSLGSQKHLTKKGKPSFDSSNLPFPGIHILFCSIEWISSILGLQVSPSPLQGKLSPKPPGQWMAPHHLQSNSIPLW